MLYICKSFDAWGRRRDPVTWDYISNFDWWLNYQPTFPKWLFRGFTGHEHLDVLFGIELINMNARLYDPVLGRMLRWDTYAGDGSTQGFNRYSYAMNNPLKYTDPTGNFPVILAAMAVSAVIYGIGNLAAHYINGDVTNFKTGAGYFLQGAAVGAVMGAVNTLTAGIPILSPVIKAAKFINGVSSVFSAVGGVISNGGDGLANAGRILLSKYYLDENKSFLGGVWEGISRHTYQGLQTTVGYAAAQFSNGIGKVNDVEYFGGATFSHTTWGGGSITLGNNIMLGGNENENNITVGPGGYTFMHEYGHYIQSQKFGYTYLFKYGIASARGAEWTEWDANQRSANYMRDNFGFNWNPNYYTGTFSNRYSRLPGILRSPQWWDFVPPITFFSSLWR